jgi:hypothetical protein
MFASEWLVTTNSHLARFGHSFLPPILNSTLSSFKRKVTVQEEKHVCDFLKASLLQEDHARWSI